jgi:hypothetical protein
MVNSWVGYTHYQATLAARSSILPSHLALLDMIAYRQGSVMLQLDLKFNGPIRRHPRQIIEKHIGIFTDNSVNRCLETSDMWQL